jgi:hypothetical protein
VPNTSYTFTGPFGPGSGTLNSSGQVTFPLNLPAGSYTFNFSFAGSGNTRAFTITAS